MIKELQDAMLNMEQADCPVFNHFTDGLYARELHIPAGVCIVGAEHKTRHFLMIVQGECVIAKDDDEAKIHQAPQLIETQEGDKRAITAVTDTILMTFHVTDKTDVADIGNEILAHDNCLPHWKQKALGGTQ